MITRPLVLYLGAAALLYGLLATASLAKNAVLHTIIVTLSHVIPIILCCLLSRKQNNFKPFCMSRQAAKLTAFSFPLVYGAVLFSAFVSSVLTTLTYASTEAVSLAMTPYNFLRHACLTALLEELFFRLLPLRLFDKEHMQTALLISVITFSLFHADGFRFLYAITAGLLFFVLDLLAESIFPSIFIHAGINSLSLIYANIVAIPHAVFVFFSLTGLLFVASVIWLFLQRKKIAKAIKRKLNFT